MLIVNSSLKWDNFIVTENVLAGGSEVDDEIKSKRYTALMTLFNEHVANHPQLESVLMPIGDGMTISIAKQ